MRVLIPRRASGFLSHRRRRAVTAPHILLLFVNNCTFNMLSESASPSLSSSSSSAVTSSRRRIVSASLFIFFTVSLYLFLLYKASSSIDFLNHFSFVSSNLPDNSSLVSKEYRLEDVLNAAAMKDKTVILTTLNEAWANSVLDLFIESFKIGENTRELLNHLVIIALDNKAFIRCLTMHAHCFPLVTEGINFSREAYYMTADYLKMMWRRIDFLHTVLEMGYNFIFTDADVMWFRNPFPQFFLDADFQIACDHFLGSSDNIHNRPNGGFNYVKSNNRSILFYKFWYAAREAYHGYHDQDVLNFIKYNPFVTNIGLKIRFLDTAHFGGLCEPSRDLNEVCTMHANCCLGLESKLHDLKIMLQDWKNYQSLPPSLKGSAFWRVPQNCSIEALLRGSQEMNAKYDGAS